MRVWTLRRAVEGAVRQGYPWVFSNQLAHSPKEASPGELVTLQDFAGHWVALGYAHPHSLISFRALSLDAREKDVGSPAFFLRRLARASALRQRLGMSAHSHRLCFAEADGVPGLIVDRYRLAGETPSQVLAVESSTAGMDAALPAVLEALEHLVNDEAGTAGFPRWSNTGVLLDQAGPIRQLEELVLLPKAWHKPLSIDGASILTAPPRGAEPLTFRADLLEGQKTGFFLDHSRNLDLAEQVLLPLARNRKHAPVRMLDLFCYVGQWSARLAAALAHEGVGAQVTAVDASQKALELASANIAAQGATVQAERMDIVERLGDYAGGGYDVVICDPPALVKRRKDLPKSTRAYQKLNREAMKRVAPGGLLITCSCSGLMPEDDFAAMLGHAAHQAQRSVRWVARGGQGADHPIAAVFPEGRYLKCWIGIVD